jgi:hypothetical protein
MGAEYLEAKATIHLLSGIHYALWNYERYLPSMKDLHSNHMDVTIQPLFCSKGPEYADYCVEDDETVTIMNKRRSFLFFEVHKKLTITNIIFDAIDSIIRCN